MTDPNLPAGSRIILPHEDAYTSKTPPLRFDMSELDRALCEGIVARYKWLVETNSVHKVDYFTTLMDISAVHCNTCPLNLRAFNEAPAQTLYDEVAHIVRTIDRKTGALKGRKSLYARPIN